ncbi:MAG: LPS-assembly protein LptD [Rubrivivax sp.]
MLLKSPRWLACALRPVAAAAACACGGGAALGQAAPPETTERPAATAAPGAAPTAPAAPAAASPASLPRLRLDRELGAAARAGDKPQGAAWVEARRIQSFPSAASAPGGVASQRLVAEGDVAFRHTTAVLRADRVSYDGANEQLDASGQVRISREGAVYSGPALSIRLDTFEGWFERPAFEFPRFGSGGQADRLEFLGSNRARAFNADYTSCPREAPAPGGPDGGADVAVSVTPRAGAGAAGAKPAAPAWILQTRRLDLNFNTNEGLAEGAVLRFLGVPILAAPVLSFPITDDRKSGWLPPNVNLDSRSGLDVTVPYYWNIAPHRDMTVTPRLMTRRGLGADVEWRYLERQHEGLLGLDVLPHDSSFGRGRWAWRADHLTTWGADAPAVLRGTTVQWTGARVSDDSWWKDFPRGVTSLTPRLLSQRAAVERPLALGWADGSLYARLAHWQVLQADEAIVSPYQRSPQLGLQLRASGAFGLRAEATTELNRFTLARRDAATAAQPEGWRWHAQAALERPWNGDGWWLRPRLSLNTAYYQTDGRAAQHRSVPSVSLDAGATFERDTLLMGRSLRQVLEPRIRYVRTPFREQSHLPNYDSAGKDFNSTSIYSDNAWSGVDRQSDSHQLTFGATTWLLRESDGAEVLRLGLVQRLLLDPQLVTPDDSNPVKQSATPLTRQLSDLLLIGSTRVVPRWALEGTVRYNADTQRAVRSVFSARYVADDFRTLSAAYRFTRGQSEQVDFGWQWPLTSRRSGQSGQCPGRLFGVGRINYSLRDSRITDSLLGLEYDSGCWIGRIVAERVSTGRSEATTRLMLQLELVGLSRLGSNPLRVLKENIPGYRLLRDDRGESSPSTSPLHD